MSSPRHDPSCAKINELFKPKKLSTISKNLVKNTKNHDCPGQNQVNYLTSLPINDILKYKK